MAIQQDAAEGDRGLKDTVVRTTSAAGSALGQLAGGLGTGFLALLVLFSLAVTAAASLVGVGLLMAPAVLRALHALAARERVRLARWGAEVVAPEPPPTRLRLAVVDPTTRRELRWLAGHAALGFPLGLLGVFLPIAAVRDSAFPLYWKLAPEDATATSLGFGTAHSWPDALAVALLGLGWIAIILGLTPGMADLQALAGTPPSRGRLGNGSVPAYRRTDRHPRRRAGRSRHRTAPHRALAARRDAEPARRGHRPARRGPPHGWPATRRVPTNSSNAPRTPPNRRWPNCVRSRAASCRRCWPTADWPARSTGLAANCAVPCRIDVDVPGRCAASVEATAYFVVAEALTNIAKHSGAEHATVTRPPRRRPAAPARSSDDGRGGADEDSGSGLTGIRRRIEAHDGHFTLASPPGGPTTLRWSLPCGS